jgi:hypothetical protein
MFYEKKGEYSSNFFLSFYRKSIKYYGKVLFFRAGKEGNMSMKKKENIPQIFSSHFTGKV